MEATKFILDFPTEVSQTSLGLSYWLVGALELDRLLHKFYTCHVSEILKSCHFYGPSYRLPPPSATKWHW